MRPVWLAMVIGLGVLAPVAPEPAHAGPTEPAPPPRIEVGAELVAVREVTLREARLPKGARVRVVEVITDKGAPVAVSLELKDGHVLHGVSYRKVKENFRPAPRG